MQTARSLSKFSEFTILTYNQITIISKPTLVTNSGVFRKSVFIAIFTKKQQFYVIRSTNTGSKALNIIKLPFHVNHNRRFFNFDSVFITNIIVFSIKSVIKHSHRPHFCHNNIKHKIFIFSNRPYNCIITSIPKLFKNI